MKIAYYCQHVLGIGHFFRTIEICRAFEGHDVLLFSGGLAVDITLPKHVRLLQLPGLMMDPNFSRLSATKDGQSLEQVKKDRLRILLDCFQRFRPEILIIELYPFGRRAFRFEIEPILEAIGARKLPSCRVVCSLRDILVEKKDPATYEERVINILNKNFNALLVHSDPHLMKLDETFSRINDIHIPVFYTGFVSQKPGPDPRRKIRKKLAIAENDRLIIASAGGGKVGFPLLEAVMKAFKLLKTRGDGMLYVFSGPYISRAEYDRLNRLAAEGIRIARFSPDFLSFLAAADLSVSMAGYNTCMNILATGTPALVWPFSQNREQRLRAERLAGRGVLKVLTDDDLRTNRLAALMEKERGENNRCRVSVDLEGAQNTVRWLVDWITSSVDR
ncbi:glycosyltransferase family protein [Thermodesulfobacteriota bacterium]